MATITKPQQPGLRAFIVYDRLPAGCIAHEVPGDEAAPFLRAGDVAVIDVSDREPMHGELFLRQLSTHRQVASQVVEVRRFDTTRCTMPGGEPFTETMWGMHWTNNVAVSRHTGRWVDGPCYTPAMKRMLLGRVIGILEPAFAEPMRLTGAGER